MGIRARDRAADPPGRLEPRRPQARRRRRRRRRTASRRPRQGEEEVEAAHDQAEHDLLRLEEAASSPGSTSSDTSTSTGATTAPRRGPTRPPSRRPRQAAAAARHHRPASRSRRSSPRPRASPRPPPGPRRRRPPGRHRDARAGGRGGERPVREQRGDGHTRPGQNAHGGRRDPGSARAGRPRPARGRLRSAQAGRTRWRGASRDIRGAGTSAASALAGAPLPEHHRSDPGRRRSGAGTDEPSCVAPIRPFRTESTREPLLPMEPTWLLRSRRSPWSRSARREPPGRHRSAPQTPPRTPARPICGRRWACPRSPSWSSIGDLRPLPVAAPAAGRVRVPGRRPGHGSDLRRPRPGRRGRRR